MPFDYKKEYKEFYLPKDKPTIVTIPKINYLAVRGTGNPNDVNSEYQKSIGLLYGVSFTIKMSYKSEYDIPGYFPYVVPPLEGFWWQNGIDGIDYTKKNEFHFISLIRLPDFVTKDVFNWAIEEATKKKKIDFSKVEFLEYDEGLCVQCMHHGSFDSEPVTVKHMSEYANSLGYQIDITDKRYHHEIYLSDPRKCSIEKNRTIIRYPIRSNYEAK